MSDQTYWLTRDENDDGEVSDLVDVWLSQPHRKTLLSGNGCVWLDNSTTGLEGRHTQWTVAYTMSYTNSHVYPANSRECIKVGN